MKNLMFDIAGKVSFNGPRILDNIIDSISRLEELNMQKYVPSNNFKCRVLVKVDSSSKTGAKSYEK